MKATTMGKRQVAAKAKEVAGKRKSAHIAQTGLTTRTRGHLSASIRRAQGKRDSR